MPAIDRPENYERWPKGARVHVERLENRLRDADSEIARLRSIIQPEGQAPSRVTLGRYDEAIPLRAGEWDTDGARAAITFDLRTDIPSEPDRNYISMRLAQRRGALVVEVMGEGSMVVEPWASNVVHIYNRER